MKFSLADKIALIYTSAGSMRKTAALAGLTHQQVSRILHKQSEGKPLTYYENKSEIVAAIDIGLKHHRDYARSVSRRHQIPYIDEVPIFSERLMLRNQAVFVDDEFVFTGSPEACAEYIEDNGLEDEAEIRNLLGDRVGALHTHWISDRLRNAWIKRLVKSGKYYSASVGSIVDLPKYMQDANARIKAAEKLGYRPTKQALGFKKALKKIQREMVDEPKLQRIFTPMSSITGDQDPDRAALSIEQTLQERHSTAVGEKGTAYADQILLQVDTRTVKNAPAKQRKARRNKK